MERTRFRAIWRTAPRPGSSDLSRLQCAWNAAQWHLPVVGVSWFAGVRCAGTSVRRDFGTHWRPRLSWRLRCAGTSVHWVHGTLGSTIALASAVRRDFGAPGLRCTEATSSAASTHGRPGSPHRSEQRAAPAVPVPRTGLLDLAASHGRTPRELHLRRVLDPEGTTPVHLRPPYESSCAATSGAPSALPSRGRNTSVDGAALLGTIDTSEALRLDAFSSVR